MNSLNKNSTAPTKSKRLGYLFGLALISSAAFSIFSPPANASCFINTNTYAMCQQHWIVR